MIRDLNIFATVARTVTRDDHSLTPVDGSFERFMVSLDPLKESKLNDSSPRDNRPTTLRWRTGLLGPSSPLAAGWRLALTRPMSPRAYENQVYELLATPREYRVGSVTEGVVAMALPVVVLYPYSTTIREQDGTELLSATVALWSSREDHQTTGTYEEFEGEAPIEFADALRANRWLDLDEKRYRITSSITDLEGPRVKFTARRSNG